MTPGITIRDPIRVLKPNDPDSYYQSRELVPSDMHGDLDRTKMFIPIFHAFQLRELAIRSRFAICCLYQSIMGSVNVDGESSKAGLFQP